MQTNEFRPMSVGQIVDQTFRLYRRNFVRFMVIVAIVQVPIALLTLMLNLISRRIVEERSASDAAAAVAISGILIVLFFAMISKSLSNAALLKSVSESYLGRSVTVGQAYRFVLPKLWTLIAASFVVGIVVMFGLALLIVPGVIFSLWFALTTQAIVIENRKSIKGMSRSRSLVSGNLGKVFLMSLVVLLITGIIGGVFGGAGAVLGQLVVKESPTLALLIEQLGSLIGEVLAAPIGASAMILLYYDLRIRKEGFDLEMLAASLSGKEAGANVPTPTS